METTYNYRISTDYPKGILYRETSSDTILDYHTWHPKSKKWEQSEEAAGAFVGFEPSKSITEEEALKIVAGES